MAVQKTRRRWPVIVFALVITLLLGAAGLYQVANARSFQLAGKLTNRVETTEKLVALTFDDGPDEHTQEIIDALAAERAPATFFVVGAQMEANPGMAEALVKAGHQLANHTYTHRRMIFVSEETVAGEIERTDRLIRAAGQQGEIFFRPPTGKKLVTLPLYLSEHDRHTVMWDLEPDSGATPTAAEIVTQVGQEVRPGSIILLHPWYQSGQNTRDAIKDLTATLRADGYRFVTVGELLARA
ncbi:Peptidoglycan/xylan/chitin deacetylase, PgdA/CDA1 family [Nonomuraea solani]|uniref:Peptidoglycan/xylan/chitin deacetylase, PgdA/CDA1 family n=1 Tax=Nonomuraea solani TaxID=1144553 RepID=A0A1H6BUH1_9ACTN|nr:polysaccharide deacetylase family protein [Nonomuraea solani]SEG64303.1 Peptidoglycan/xylan/chitin deacetylase, PgdA/CDA1 family [Nonomuraea solani]